MFHPPTILYTMSYDTSMFIILFMYAWYDVFTHIFDVHVLVLFLVKCFP